MKYFLIDLLVLSSMPFDHINTKGAITWSLLRGVKWLFG